MKPNGRRAWRKAAKKLRWKMGRRWRSQEEWVHGKRWSELVPDLEAHRAHITGTWFKRHGFQSFDAESSSRHYIGLWGSANGETSASSITARSLVGMTTGARKRAVRREFDLVPCPEYLTTIQDRMQWYLLRGPYLRAKYRIGERLRPCPGCCSCGPCYCGNPSTCIGLYDSMYVHDKPSPACDVCCGHGCEDGHCYKRDDAITCDGSGVIPARKKGSKP